MRTGCPAAALFLLLFLPGPAGSSPTDLQGGSIPRAFLDPVEGVRLLENHYEALPLWAETGIKDAIVLHVDSHHDMLSNGKKEDFEPLRKMVESGDYRGMKRAGHDIYPGALYDYTNYLVPAYHLGIVREIWWVLPVQKPMDGDFLMKLQKFLGERQFGKFSMEEISQLRLEGAYIRGTLGGVPLTISRVESIPSFEEPVLLDLDCDYLVGDPTWDLGADHRSSGMEQPLTDFLLSMRKKEIPVKRATVVYSVEGNYLPIHYRYVGTLLQKWLVDPDAAEEILSSGSWKGFWEGERAFLKGDWEEAALLLSEPGVSSGETSPYAGLYLAFTEMLRGDRLRALSLMEDLVARAPEFSLAYLGMGDYYARSGEVETALDLYERLKQYPLIGTYLSLSRAGHLHFNRGDAAAAVPYYGQLLELYPHRHRVRSYLGDAYFTLGEHRKAYDLYRKIWEEGEPTLQRVNPNYLPNFITSSLAVGDREMAVKALKALVDIDPSAKRINKLKSLVEESSAGDPSDPRR